MTWASILSSNLYLIIFSVITNSLRHHYKTLWNRLETQESLIEYEIVGKFSKHNLDQRHSFFKDYNAKRFYLTAQFAMETILLSLHPIPYFHFEFKDRSINYMQHSQFLEVTFYLSHLLLCLMFLKLIFVVRSIFNYTIFTSTYSKRLW